MNRRKLERQTAHRKKLAEHWKLKRATEAFVRENLGLMLVEFFGGLRRFRRKEPQ